MVVSKFDLTQSLCEGGWMSVFDRFLNDTKGAVTIEFVVLFPAFIFLLVFFADTSILYLTHSEMYNAARDAARRISTHQLQSEDDVKSFVAERLNLGGRTYALDPSGFNGGVARVTIAVGINQAVFFGALFGPILGRSLVASASVRVEPVLLPVS